jgi:hypothetical protein
LDVGQLDGRSLPDGATGSDGSGDGWRDPRAEQGPAALCAGAGVLLDGSRLTGVLVVRSRGDADFEALELDGVAAGDVVEELTAADVDDLGRPRLATERAVEAEQVSSSPGAVTVPHRLGSSTSGRP